MDGINLLASILVCYPEIGTVSYEPGEDEALRFTYALSPLPAQRDCESAAAALRDSIETYHALAGVAGARIGISLEAQGRTAFLHLIRDVRTLSRGEIGMVSQLMADRFGDALLVDPLLDMEEMDAELDAREDAIDHMLGALRLARGAARIVGIREDGRVLVFNK